MNILFIGGAGFIGSNLIKRLLNESGYKIYVLEPQFANISRIENIPVKIFRGELMDVDLLESIIASNNIDMVVHLVSTLIPGSCYEDFIDEYQNVIFPSIRLMEICCRYDVKFVYFSSGGTVYGERKSYNPFKEDEELKPISYYGWSKQMMENSILFKNRTQGLKYIIIRPSNPFGHGQNLFGKQGLIAVSLGKIISDQPVEVWGNGSAVRDYIYIDDLSDALTKLIQDDKIQNVTINLGSGVGYSVNDILAFLKIVSGKDFEIKYVEARNVDVSNMILNIDKLKSLIEFRTTPILDGMKAFYEECMEIKKIDK